MYGEAITPNQHQLARQFGVLDNFYDSGEVSGDGHVWSTAAITSDYTEKTWQIGYRGDEHTYDYEGAVGDGIPLEEGQPDVNEPGTGYLWANAERHGVTHRNYGEFVFNRMVRFSREGERRPFRARPAGRKMVRSGEPLPANVGEPHGCAKSLALADSAHGARCPDQTGTQGSLRPALSRLPHRLSRPIAGG